MGVDRAVELGVRRRGCLVGTDRRLLLEGVLRELTRLSGVAALLHGIWGLVVAGIGCKCGGISTGRIH